MSEIQNIKVIVVKSQFEAWQALARYHKRYLFSEHYGTFEDVIKYSSQMSQPNRSRLDHVKLKLSKVTHF